MSGQSALSPLDLAALLCSRVCHDLISPVGAIVNGLEVLDEKDSDEETKTFALDLIRKSAKTASARLQFCRIAFGAAGSAGATVDTGDAQNMARGFIEDDKTKLTWNLDRLLLPKNKVKLLLNMLVIATQTIPRGGNITVDPIGSGDAISFKVTSVGANIRVPPALPPLLAGTNEAPVDAQGIQAHYTGLLAQSCDLKVEMALEGESVVITAQPTGAAAAAE